MSAARTFGLREEDEDECISIKEEMEEDEDEDDRPLTFRSSPGVAMNKTVAVQLSSNGNVNSSVVNSVIYSAAATTATANGNQTGSVVTDV